MVGLLKSGSCARTWELLVDKVRLVRFYPKGRNTGRKLVKPNIHHFLSLVIDHYCFIILTAVHSVAQCGHK